MLLHKANRNNYTAYMQFALLLPSAARSGGPEKPFLTRENGGAARAAVFHCLPMVVYCLHSDQKVE